jgi:hypothetical protein
MAILTFGGTAIRTIEDAIVEINSENRVLA